MAFDTVAKAVVEFRGDTSDLKAKIRQLKGEEKKLAEQQLAQANARNKQLETWVSRLGKVALGVGAVTAAVVIGGRSFDHYLKESRLMAAAGTADIAKLDKAAGGLKTRMELLQFAAETSTGKFKLSSAQMVIAQKAMLQLTREGKDQVEVTNKVTEALVKLEGDGLKDFGIHVKAAKTDTEKFNAILEALSGKAKEADGSIASQAESVQKLGVDFKDAMDSVKTSLGKIVVSLAPLLQSVAKLAEYSSDLLGHYTGIADLTITALTGGDKEALFLRLGGDPNDLRTRTDGSRYEEFVAAGGSQSNFLSAEIARSAAGGYQTSFQDSRGAADPVLARLVAEEKAAREAAAERARAAGPGPFRGTVRDIVGRVMIEEARAIAGSGGLGAAAGGATDMYGRDSIGGFDLAGLANQRATENWMDRINNLQAQGPSFLEKMFGPKGEFDIYGSLFSNLTSAMQSAYSGLVDGTLSAGDAAKQVLKGVLTGLGTQMLGESVMQLGKGFAALANPLTAATAPFHFKSAAVFAGGAALMGVAASQVGGGGARGGAPGGGAGAYSGGAPSSAPQGGSPIIVTGDSFADDSPRNRQLRARKLVKRALGSTGAVTE